MSDPTRPTIRQLEYLVALSETLNFREAAELCHVSQPALSAQIRELEKLLGVTLFERDSRRVLETTAGRVLAERAHAMLEELDRSVASVKSGGEPFHQPIRMGVIPTIAPYALPPVLDLLTNRAPQLELTVREERTSDVVAHLASGRLDVGLLALEAPLGRGLVEKAISRDDFTVALPPSHALTQKKTLEESDLDGEPVLLLDDGHCLRDQSLALCRRSRAVELGDFSAASLRTLIQLVENGAGITLIPELARSCEVHEGSKVEVRPFAGTVPSRTIGLVWREGSPRQGEFETLAEWIGEAI